jgi:hypothetical protein
MYDRHTILGGSMKKLIDVKVSEKEWKHIQSCYRRFAEDKDCQRCPMGWTPREFRLFKPKVNRILFAKFGFEKINGDFLCLCHQFKEFDEPRYKGDCPCNTYKKSSTAFTNLDKLIARWDEEMN